MSPRWRVVVIRPGAGELRSAAQGASKAFDLWLTTHPEEFETVELQQSKGGKWAMAISKQHKPDLKVAE